MIPKITQKALTVMQLLKNNPGMYGLQIVDASEGQVKKGTIYVVLSSLQDEGWITSNVEQNPKYSGMPRKLYSLTGEGARILALKEQADAIWRGSTEHVFI